MIKERNTIHVHTERTSFLLFVCAYVLNRIPFNWNALGVSVMCAMCAMCLPQFTQDCAF